MTSDIPFEDLIAGARAGQEGAAAKLFQTYGPEIRQFIAIRCGRDRYLRGIVDPSDVMQSVFLRLFDKLKAGRFQLREPRDLARLLTRMAGNALKDKKRYHFAGIRDLHKQSAGESGLGAIADPGSAPVEVLSRREELEEDRRLLERARGRLPEWAWELLQRKADGEDWNALGAAFGVDPEALRKRLERALRQARAAGREEAP